MRSSDWSADVFSSDLPAEFENAIFGHPAVQEDAVFGIPAAKWGEAVKAVVVAKPGTTVEESDIIDWARERIAPFKAPRSIDVIVALTRNASAKILRKDLRAPYWEGYERMVTWRALPRPPCYIAEPKN